MKEEDNNFKMFLIYTIAPNIHMYMAQTWLRICTVFVRSHDQWRPQGEGEAPTPQRPNKAVVEK